MSVRLVDEKIMRAMIAIIAVVTVVAAFPEPDRDVNDVNTGPNVVVPENGPGDFDGSGFSTMMMAVSDEGWNPPGKRIEDAKKAVEAAKNCNKDTGGTCSILNCYKWRHATCDSGGKCMCPGQCAVNGKCVDNTALKTAQNNLKNAKESYHKQAIAKKKKEKADKEASAKKEKAAKEAKAKEVKKKEQAAKEAKAKESKKKENYTKCNANRNAAEKKTKSGHEVVEKAKAAKLSAKHCNKDTFGSCSIMSCWGWRHATCDSGGKCMCPGQCAVNGKCVDNTELKKAQTQLDKANGKLDAAKNELSKLHC